MGFAEDMGNLGEKMIISFGNRLKIMKDLHIQALEDRKNRKKFVKDLADSEKSDSKERQKFCESITEYCESITKYVDGFLDDFVDEYNEMAKKQKYSLQAFVEDLADSGKSGSKERQKFCESTTKYVNGFLDDFVDEYNEMARKQKHSLQAFVKDLVDSGKSGSKERQKFCESTTKYVNGFLDDFVDKYNEMAKKQKHSLRAFVEDLVDSGKSDSKERQKFCESITEYCESITKYVDGFLENWQGECKKAHQNFERAMKEKASMARSIKAPKTTIKKSIALSSIKHKEPRKPEKTLPPKIVKKVLPKKPEKTLPPKIIKEVLPKKKKRKSKKKSKKRRHKK